MLDMVGMVFSRVTFDEMDPFGARVYKRCSGRFQLVVHDAWGSEGKRLSDDAGRCQAVQGVLKGATLRIGHGEFLVDAHPTMTIRGTRQMAVSHTRQRLREMTQPCAMAASHIGLNKISTYRRHYRRGQTLECMNRARLARIGACWWWWCWM
jgi:hypothetical protein